MHVARETVLQMDLVSPELSLRAEVVLILDPKSVRIRVADGITLALGFRSGFGPCESLPYYV